MTHIVDRTEPPHDPTPNISAIKEGDIREKIVKSVSGIPFLCILVVLAILAGLAAVTGRIPDALRIVVPIIVAPSMLIGFSGLYKVEPNQAAVLSLFCLLYTSPSPRD